MLFQVAMAGDTEKPFTIECEAEGEPAPKWVSYFHFLQFFIIKNYIDSIAWFLGNMIRRGEMEQI